MDGPVYDAFESAVDIQDAPIPLPNPQFMSATPRPSNARHTQVPAVTIVLCVLAAVLLTMFVVAIWLAVRAAAKRTRVPRPTAAQPHQLMNSHDPFDPLAPPPSCRRTVIVGINSGTGNVLFKLAHALALCTIHRAGLLVHSPAGPDLASDHAQRPVGLFAAFANRLLQGPVPKGAVAWEENSDWGSGLLDQQWPRDNPSDVYVAGTHQCTDALDAIGAIGQLARLLHFTDDDHAAANRMLSSTPPHGTRNVCLHVRRGDYLHEHWQQVFTQLTPAYYTQCIGRVSGPVRVCVFSDDLPWCRRQPWLATLPHVWFEPAGQALTATLLCMSKCDCFIVSNSTFAMWGALLADVRAAHAGGVFVQGPRQWFKASRREHSRHMYPMKPNWVRVDDTTGEVAVKPV